MRPTGGASKPPHGYPPAGNDTTSVPTHGVAPPLLPTRARRRSLQSTVVRGGRKAAGGGWRAAGGGRRAAAAGRRATHRGLLARAGRQAGRQATHGAAQVPRGQVGKGQVPKGRVRAGGIPTRSASAGDTSSTSRCSTHLPLDPISGFGHDRPSPRAKHKHTLRSRV